MSMFAMITCKQCQYLLIELCSTSIRMIDIMNRVRNRAFSILG